MTIKNGGNVGIGTINPAFKLHVSKSGAEAFEFYPGYSANSNIFQGYNRSSSVYTSLESRFADYHFKNGTTEVVTINTSGNVGIGTTNPNYKLDVNATGGFAAVRGAHVGTNSLNAGGLFVSSGAATMGTNVGVVASASGGASNYNLWLYFLPASATNYSIYSEAEAKSYFAGSIGIGTTLSNNPNNYKLAVNGTIGAKAVKVENNSATWPDFVFDVDYGLMDLHELDEYLKGNKHLPLIPNAKEIEECGLDVGELLRLQMQKIEELTLYIIEQNKRIEKLEENGSK